MISPWKKHLHDAPTNTRSFYYRVYEKTETEELLEVYPDWETCLGYIGDLIIHILFDASECISWRVLLGDDENDEASYWSVSQNNFVFTIPNVKPDVTDDIVSLVDRVSNNWDMNLTVTTIEQSADNDAVFITVPKNVLLATKWKMQGLMQLIRILFHGHQFINNGHTFIINGEKYANYKLTVGYDRTPLSLIYALSFVPIGDELSFLDEDDPIYEGDDITTLSHEFGVLTLIENIFEHYVSEDKK